MNLSQADLNKIKSMIGRQPTTVESYIFDTMWSEHCSYKSTKPILKQLPTTGRDVALGIGEDAGIIRFTKHNGKQYCLAVSHESHNHPSQILPIEGAATGVGGVVRDVYCMGADVIGVLNSLHFGIDQKGDNPIIDDITADVVKGVSDYANPLGVPVLGGETLYHESYNDNCLVNVAGIGLVIENDIIHSFAPDKARDELYDVILLGKSTDATGFGGASFSSTTLDDQDQQLNMGAVQVHDPFLKRVLVQAIRAILDYVKTNQVEIGFKDLGAGGIACATSEIASANQFGVRIQLEDVNCSIDGLAAEVIACSETQERFCLVVPKTHTQAILDIVNQQFALPELYPQAGAAVIGQIITEPRYIIQHNGETVCDLPISSITTEVRENRVAAPRDICRQNDAIPRLTNNDVESLCYRVLESHNAESKRYVYRYFDNAVQGNTVTYPGESDAMVVTPIPDCSTGMAVSMDSNLYGQLDPYMSGVSAVSEAIRNIIAVGARPIALTDCLNYGNPEKPDVFYDFDQGVKGIAAAANQLSFIDNEPVPIISGNVSLYNESKKGRAIVPSPVILALGKLPDFTRALTMNLKSTQSAILWVGTPKPQFGATVISQLMTHNFLTAPQIDLDQEALQNQWVAQTIEQFPVKSCHDISSGGAWMSFVEMCMGEHGNGRIGMNVTLDIDPFLALFSESSGYLLEVDKVDVAAILAQPNTASIDVRCVGETTQNPELSITFLNESIVLPLTKMKEKWTHKCV